MQAIILAITVAANACGVPSWILQEVAFVESSFQADAVHVNQNGSVDRGLFQLNDKAHPKADPWCPVKSSYYAARYLKKLYKITGSWRDALIAYNVGIGRWMRGYRPSRYARKVLSANPEFL